MEDRLGTLDELIAQLTARAYEEKWKLMADFKPYEPTFQEKGGVRAYVHRDTTNREVRDGVVWCTDHDVPLREYRDVRAKIQRKCRPCANEAQRRWSLSTAKGQQADVRKRARQRG